MPLLIWALIVIVVIGIALLAITSHSSEQHVECPACGLDFVVDPLFFFDLAFLQCPFCRTWLVINKSKAKYTTKKIFA